MIFQSLRVEGAVDGDDATGNGIHDRPVRDARPRIALAIKYRSSDAGGGWARLGKTEHDGRRTAYQGRRPLQFCWVWRSEEHTSELQSLMRISYAVFCLKKKKQHKVTQQ